MSDIFISYKREDQTAAKTLAELLENNRWTVWWDPQLRAGEHFDKVIERELDNAKCVIVIWSSRSIQSQYVKDEASYALRNNKLIPVAIEKVLPPFRFQGLHTLHLSDWPNLADSPAFQKLLADIQYILSIYSSDETFNTPKQSAPVNKPVSEKYKSETEENHDHETSILGATAIYGESFKKTQAPDFFMLRVYVNLFATAKDADIRAKKEINLFLKEQDYGSYTIIKRQHNFFRGYYEYTIQFKNN